MDWIFEKYQVRNPGANINYQSIGSGGGIRQFLEQTVDFGASERYLHPEQLQRARADRGCDAIQFPIVFGSVTIAFNDDFYDELILDGNAIADIFERRITRYNDPAIQQNAGALGYLNQAYVLIQGFPQARIVNADGNAVLATTQEGAEIASIPSSFQAVFAITGVTVELLGNDPR